MIPKVTLSFTSCLRAACTLYGGRQWWGVWWRLLCPAQHSPQLLSGPGSLLLSWVPFLQLLGKPKSQSFPFRPCAYILLGSHSFSPQLPIHFFFLILIYLVLAALGLRCCARAFSSCSERGLLFVAVHGLLITVASLVAGRGL